LFQSRQAAVTLLSHAGALNRFALGQIADKIKVAIVAEYALALRDGGFRAVCAIFPAAGPYANDEQFSLASATVIPVKFVLGSISSVR